MTAGSPNAVIVNFKPFIPATTPIMTVIVLARQAPRMVNILRCLRKELGIGSFRNYRSNDKDDMIKLYVWADGSIKFTDLKVSCEKTVDLRRVLK